MGGIVCHWLGFAVGFGVGWLIGGVILSRMGKRP